MSVCSLCGFELVSLLLRFQGIEPVDSVSNRTRVPSPLFKIWAVSSRECEPVCSLRDLNPYPLSVISNPSPLFGVPPRVLDFNGPSVLVRTLAPLSGNRTRPLCLNMKPPLSPSSNPCPPVRLSGIRTRPFLGLNPCLCLGDSNPSCPWVPDLNP